MRCYFIRNSRIEAVYLLAGGSDEDLVYQGNHLFEKFAGPGTQSFEVWEGSRFIYRHEVRQGQAKAEFRLPGELKPGRSQGPSHSG